MRVILEAEPDVRVVGEASDGAEAVEQAIQLADVVVMDIRMPGRRRVGGDAAAAARLPRTRVLVVTTTAATRRWRASAWSPSGCRPRASSTTWSGTR
jgi:DNA-binding NarL/FixJ family response regulator